MNQEQLIKAFKLFFPDLQVRSILDDDTHLEVSCTTDDHIKYSVLYSKSTNYLKVCTYNFSVVTSISIHAEGEPAYICKLAKLIEQ